MLSGQNTQYEVCANCGNLVETLDDVTGWCYTCAGIEERPLVNWYIKWLTINADEIERMMVFHCVTVSTAKKIVAQNNRPICLCCKKPINRGNKRSVFCTTTPKCRIAQKVFDRSHHLSREEAIQKALEEATIQEILYGVKAA